MVNFECVKYLKIGDCYLEKPQQQIACFSNTSSQKLWCKEMQFDMSHREIAIRLIIKLSF